MAEGVRVRGLTFLESPLALAVINGVIPHITTAAEDIQRLSDQVAAIFEAKAAAIPEEVVVIADTWGIMEAISEFEKKSFAFCTKARGEVGKLLAGRDNQQVGIQTLVPNPHGRAELTN